MLPLNYNNGCHIHHRICHSVFLVGITSLGFPIDFQLSAMPIARCNIIVMIGCQTKLTPQSDYCQTVQLLRFDYDPLEVPHTSTCLMFLSYTADHQGPHETLWLSRGWTQNWPFMCLVCLVILWILTYCLSTQFTPSVNKLIMNNHYCIYIAPINIELYSVH